MLLLFRGKLLRCVEYPTCPLGLRGGLAHSASLDSIILLDLFILLCLLQPCLCVFLLALIWRIFQSLNYDVHNLKSEFLLWDIWETTAQPFSFACWALYFSIHQVFFGESLSSRWPSSGRRWAELVIQRTGFWGICQLQILNLICNVTANSEIRPERCCCLLESCSYWGETFPACTRLWQSKQ